MIPLFDIKQLSPEWYAEKAGKPSASKADKIITSTGKPSDSANAYRYQLAGEAILGKKPPSYQNAAMEWGIEHEPMARGRFSVRTGYNVTEVGMCYRDEQRKYLCSPDGLMLDIEEGLEIKCPEMHTHIAYLDAGKLPAKYHRQVHASMLVTGYKAWWFVSYYPDLPLFMLRVERDDAFLAKLEPALDAFCLKLATTIKKLRAM